MDVLNSWNWLFVTGLLLAGSFLLKQLGRKREEIPLVTTNQALTLSDKVSAGLSGSKFALTLWILAALLGNPVFWFSLTLIGVSIDQSRIHKWLNHHHNQAAAKMLLVQSSLTLAVFLPLAYLLLIGILNTISFDLLYPWTQLWGQASYAQTLPALLPFQVEQVPLAEWPQAQVTLHLLVFLLMLPLPLALNAALFLARFRNKVPFYKIGLPEAQDQSKRRILLEALGMGLMWVLLALGIWHEPFFSDATFDDTGSQAWRLFIYWGIAQLFWAGPLIFVTYFQAYRQAPLASKNVDRKDSTASRVMLTLFLVLLVLVTLILSLSALPPVGVMAGDGLKESELASLREHQVLSSEDSVRMFSGADAFDLLQAGTLITQSKLVWYRSQGNKVLIDGLPISALMQISNPSPDGADRHHFFVWTDLNSEPHEIPIYGSHEDAAWFIERLIEQRHTLMPRE